MLEVENLCFAYGEREVLKNANLRVECGELVAVLGGNGAGKSTMFKVICGLLKPKSGCVKILGNGAESYSDFEAAKIRAAMQQDCEFNFDSTVLDYTLLGRYACGGFFSTKEDLEIAKAALEIAGLGGFESRIFTKLSGGERRRAELARALCQLGARGRKGTMLLLDEPNSNLDPKNASCALEAAKKFAMQGSAVLAILHDVNLASLYADKIALMRGGEIFAFGAPNTVITEENLRRAYGANCRVFESQEGRFAIFLRG
ncbi:MAG: ATP-binding cassette domain-containing protein [Opitutales bacterium]|nr:ATP-binding cassette domain-containing protein [Opitutales bacterium]